MSLEPIATYRLQFNAQFGFDQARQIIPYLASLGISHVYASPYLQAAKGSSHGYDIVNHTQVNEHLGGSNAHAQMCMDLKQAELGQLVDIVPNHMAISSSNPWWWDVLENGPSSHYATYFDVDWESSEERWPNKILLPILGDHYGRILEDGQLRLIFREGQFCLNYQEHTFPIDPSSLGALLQLSAEICQSEQLAFLADAYERLPRAVSSRMLAKKRHRDKAVLKQLFAKLCQMEPAVLASVHAGITRFNQDTEALDALINEQNYRLAFWRTASRDLGYRRFFDVNTLIGARVEDPEVFCTLHSLPFSWVAEGWAQGLRIDHPDGLRDPTTYFARIRQACPDSWIVAEKILAEGEEIPSAWPIEGTTGYDFLNLVGGLFIDPQGKDKLTQIYQAFIEESLSYKDTVQACKRLVIRELLGSELNRLTALLVSICEKHRRYRDYTYHDLQEAICEIAVYFPVYRTYVSPSAGMVRKQDQAYIEEAIKVASQQNPDIDPRLLDFIKDIFLLRIPGDQENELAVRFQQLTGPAMAKGVEDTAFYRFFRLASLNEVGGNPEKFGVALSHFHQACERSQKEHPKSLLATTTHDTKRSEDARARIALLSEIPEKWAAAVKKWSWYNQKYCRKSFDKNMEYLFYQTLVGSWPIDSARLAAYMQKAAREAKRHTSWTKNNQEYEESLLFFVESVRNDKHFCQEFEAFINELIPYGRVNSLAQTLIKLTAPGIPDIYQGAELWDLSLVDPDNRRPVDFARRNELLANIITISPSEILTRMDEGLPKLWVIRQALHLRKQNPHIFGPKSSYKPLMAQGAKAEHAVAYMRGDSIAVIAPRLVMGLNQNWDSTHIELEESMFENILTKQKINGGKLFLQDILKEFPVALLVKTSS